MLQDLLDSYIPFTFTIDNEVDQEQAASSFKQFKAKFASVVVSREELTHDDLNNSSIQQDNNHVSCQIETEWGKC